MPADPANHPPRARLAFRVGVVGHRPDRLPKTEEALAQLSGRIGQVLDIVKAAVADFQARDEDAVFYDGQTPLLRAVSPLAEGSDRMFAREALARGFKLNCPMPFFQAEFEKDFAPGKALSPNSVAEFRELLEAAAATGQGDLVKFELDGSREDEGAAYGAGGRMVMNQSDLLVVVWDGRGANGAGGTVETLHEAIRFRVPVLWVFAGEGFSWTLIRTETDLPPPNKDGLRPPPTGGWDEAEVRRLTAELGRVVRDEVALPPPIPASHTSGKGHKSPELETRKHLQDYLAERRPPLNLNLFFVWILFRNFFGSWTIRLPTFGVKPFVSDPPSSWRVAHPDRPATCGDDWVNRSLWPHFAWVDKRAVLYADAERSAAIMISLLAASAVLLALLPIAMHWNDSEGRGGNANLDMLCVAVELLVLLSLLLLMLGSQFRRWRQRWLEYRVLAELFRQLRLLIPLGGGRPISRAPAYHQVYGDPARSWMFWQARAVARQIGLPDTPASAAYVDACRTQLHAAAVGQEEGQRGFHETTHRRSEQIHEVLHLTSWGLFIVTLVSIGMHLVVALSHAHQMPGFVPHGLIKIFDGVEAHTTWFALVAGFFPALGAALAGIANQGEFVRLAKRSHAMADAFDRFGKEIEQLKGAPLGALLPVANRMTQAMVDENLDWRVVVNDPPQAAA